MQVVNHFTGQDALVLFSSNLLAQKHFDFHFLTRALVLFSCFGSTSIDRSKSLFSNEIFEILLLEVAASLHSMSALAA